MFLFLGNAADAARNVTVHVRSGTGAPLRDVTVALPPHASVTKDVFGLLPAAPGVGASGSVGIEYTGGAHSLVAFAGLEDSTNGFSANLNLLEAHPELARSSGAHPVEIAVPGVMLGAQQAKMQFPQGTVFAPYLHLHNTSQGARTVGVLARYTSGGSGVKVALPPVVLPAMGSAAVDFGPLLTGSPAVPDAGSINLEMSFTGSEGDLVAEAGSVDGTGNYVFEAQPQMEAETISRTICYWTVFGDTNMMISLWNWSGAAEDLVLTLYYEGGSYRVPVHLEAGADRELDVGSLRREAVPDDRGNVMPSNVTEGSALLSGAAGEMAHVEVASTTSTFNVRNGTCTNQCGTCNGVTAEAVSPLPIGLTIGDSRQATANLTYNTGNTFDYSSSVSWSGSSVASVSSSGMVRGQQVGSGYTSFSVFVPVGLGYICMGNQLNCPNTTVHASATTNVKQCVLPNGETTKDVRQAVTVNSPVATDFLQTLVGTTAVPAPIDDGATIREDSNAIGTDTCYYPESPILAFNKVSGGTWIVGQISPGVSESQIVTPGTGQWGPDIVGYPPGGVRFYQQDRPKRGLPLPCGAQLTQQLTLTCPGASSGTAFIANSPITATIDSTGTTNCREGVCSSHIPYQ